MLNDNLVQIFYLLRSRAVIFHWLSADIVGDGSDSPTSAPQMLSPPTSPERTNFRRDSHDPMPSEYRNRAGIQGISKQLLALSNLEFRKLFLILHYIGR